MSDKRLAIVRVSLKALHGVLSGKECLDVRKDGVAVPWSECKIVGVFSETWLASFLRNESASIALKLESERFDIVMDGQAIPFVEVYECPMQSSKVAHWHREPTNDWPDVVAARQAEYELQLRERLLAGKSDNCTYTSAKQP